MTFKTHQVGALAAVLTAAVYWAPINLKTATIITALIANAIGALLPGLNYGGRDSPTMADKMENWVSAV